MVEMQLSHKFLGGTVMEAGIRPFFDHLELLRTLADADEDVKNGRVAQISDTFDCIRFELMERKR